MNVTPCSVDNCVFSTRYECKSTSRRDAGHFIYIIVESIQRYCDGRRTIIYIVLSSCVNKEEKRRVEYNSKAKNLLSFLLFLYAETLYRVADEDE